MHALTLFLALVPQLVPDEVPEFDLRRTPVVQVVESASPAVVYIQTDGFKHSRNFWGQYVRERVSGAGSGVVILEEGFIVTNYHVVKDSNEITVSFDQKYDEKRYPAKLISWVESEDLALLKIEDDRRFPTIPLGTSSDLMPGETVIAIGNPYGQTHTVSVGIISGLHRNVEIPAQGLSFNDLIQTDASINLGNSGGPLLNIHGELIGINSAMNTRAENIGFALPIDRVREVLDDQLLDPEGAPSFLGFEVSDSDSLVVENVLPGGPADLAGLLTGDRILGIAGEALESQEQYRLARVCVNPGQPVGLEIERGGGGRSLLLKPWDKVDGILYEGLGLTVEPLWIGRTPYVMVNRVSQGGPAYELGLQPGDRIDAVRASFGQRTLARQVTSRKWLAHVTSSLTTGSEVELEITRDLNGNKRYERSELHRGTLMLR